MLEEEILLVPAKQIIAIDRNTWISDITLQLENKSVDISGLKTFFGAVWPRPVSLRGRGFLLGENLCSFLLGKPVQQWRCHAQLRLFILSAWQPPCKFEPSFSATLITRTDHHVQYWLNHHLISTSIDPTVCTILNNSFVCKTTCERKGFCLKSGESCVDNAFPKS